MKLIKHILFLLLILQLSLANSFASVYLNKENVESRIDFSETGKLNFDFSKPNFKENYIFEPSLYDIVSCPSVSYCGVYAELVESWKVIVRKELRTDIDLLTKTDELLNNSDFLNKIGGKDELTNNL